MSNNLIAKVSVLINAPVSKVWEILTDSPVAFTGVWEGAEAEDKGRVIGIVPEKILHTAWFSHRSGQEDKPENYANVLYEICPENGRTLMTITQDHIENEGDLQHMEQTWNTVLAGMKNRIE